MKCRAMRYMGLKPAFICLMKRAHAYMNSSEAMKGPGTVFGFNGYLKSNKTGCLHQASLGSRYVHFFHCALAEV
jgi:hypothetical protein